MDFSEKTFNIRNSAGHTMYGIVHEPGESNGSLVVMFNIGLHYRVGHSRLFVRQARDLQKTGFTVARFDTSRIGYSHGEMPLGRAIDTFDSVQTGLFREDAQTVIRHLRETYRPKKVFLSGLCGGALTAIITAALEDYVDGVVFIAGPVTVTSPEYELKTLHPFEANALVAGYISKLVSPKAWIRFLSGRTSYRDLFSSIKIKISERFSPRKLAESQDPENNKDAENKGNLLNRTFLEAFDELMRGGKPVLFAMPELDRATYDFDKMFVPGILPKYSEFGEFYDIVRIEGADHTFSRPESSIILFDYIRQWLLNKAGS